jgi:hypothetical protein
VQADLDTRQSQLLAGTISASSPLDPGKPISNANDLDISHASGVVYFSASQDIVPAKHPKQGFSDTYEAYMLGLYSVRALLRLGGLGCSVHRHSRWPLGWAVVPPEPAPAPWHRPQGKPTGRLLRYDPATGETHTLANGIWCVLRSMCRLPCGCPWGAVLVRMQRLLTPDPTPPAPPAGPQVRQRRGAVRRRVVCGGGGDQPRARAAPLAGGPQGVGPAAAGAGPAAARPNTGADAGHPSPWHRAQQLPRQKRHTLYAQR